MAFYVGCDLGQSSDYTAIAAVERPETLYRAAYAQVPLYIRHLERYPLGTAYTEQADRIAHLMRSEELYAERRLGYVEGFQRVPPRLVVDATGVGKAVTDLLRERGLTFRAVTITGGDAAKYNARGADVPKRDLVAALEVPFHGGNLRVAEGLDAWPTLREELLNFRRKINKRGHDYYEHWRESDHDDLVLAAALACWEAGRRKNLMPVPKGYAGVPKPRGW